MQSRPNLLYILKIFSQQNPSTRNDTHQEGVPHKPSVDIWQRLNFSLDIHRRHPCSILFAFVWKGCREHELPAAPLHHALQLVWWIWPHQMVCLVDLAAFGLVGLALHQLWNLLHFDWRLKTVQNKERERFQFFDIFVILLQNVTNQTAWKKLKVLLGLNWALRMMH